MKKYVVTIVTSIEVQAESEKVAKRLAERYECTGQYGMGKNRVLKVADTQIIDEVA